MASIGYATLTVTPSIRGLRGQLERQLGGVIPGVGNRAGRQLGTSVNAGTRRGLGRMSAFSAVASAASSTASVIGSRFRTESAGASSSVGGIGDSFRSMAGVAGTAIAAIGFAGLVRQVGTLTTSIQDTRAALSGMYNSAGLAQRTVNDLNETFGRSRLGAEVFHNASLQLGYLGIEGRDAVTILENIETAVSAVGGGAQQIESVTGAMSVAQAQGHAFNSELQRISDSGFPILEELAAHFDTNVESVKRMASEGQVSYEDLLAVLGNPTEESFQRAERAAEGLESTLTGAFREAKNSIVLSVAEMAEPIVERLTPAVESFGERASEWFETDLPRIMRDFASDMDDRGVVDAFETLSDTMWDIASVAGPALQEFVEGFTGTWGTLFAEMEPVYDSLGDIASWFDDNEDTVTNFATNLGVVTAGFTALRGAIWLATAALRASPWGWAIMGLSGLATALDEVAAKSEEHNDAWDVLTKDATKNVWALGLLKSALEGTKTAVSWLGEGFAELGVYITQIPEGLEWLGEKTSEVMGWIVESIPKWLEWLGKKTGEVMEEFVQSVIDFFVDLYDELVGNSIVPDMVRAIISWFRSLPGAINESLIAARDWLVERFTEMRDQAVQWVMSLVEGVVGWFTNLRDRASEIVRQARTSIVNILTGLRDRAVNLVRGMRDRAVSIVTGMRDAISSRASSLRDRVVNAMNSLRRGVVSAFQRARDGVGFAWDKLREVASKPVKFVIDTVYNQGIVKLWNKVADKVPGIKELSKMDMPRGLARGGILPGTSSWRQGDDQLVPMRRGEGVYVSEAMRDPYERARLHAVNRAAMSGKSLARFRDGVPVRSSDPRKVGDVGGFALGGILRSTQSAAKRQWDDIVGGLRGWAKKPLDKMRDGLASEFGKGNDFPGIPHGMVTKFREKILAKLKKEDDSYNASLAGGADEWVGLADASTRLRRAAKWARTQHGKPYQWGGGGNPSWDCSGFIAGIENVIRGIKPGRRYTTHSFQGSPPAGWKRNLKSPFTTGVQHGGRGGGHMAGTLMGVNVESGGRGVQVGSGARGTNTFPHRFGFAPVAGDKTAKGKAHGGIVYDDGGVLKPGLQMVYNGTRKPEYIRTAAQEERVERLVTALESGGVRPVINVQPPPSTVSELVDGVTYALRKSRRGGVYSEVR